MPNRILRESCCYDDRIEALTPEEEVFLYRLTAQADDFGLFSADVDVLIGKCFTKRHRYLADDTVEGWLRSMASKNAVRIYEAGGKRYLQLLIWDQTCRAKEPKFPSPPGLVPGPVPAAPHPPLTEPKPAAAPAAGVPSPTVAAPAEVPPPEEREQGAAPADEAAAMPWERTPAGQEFEQFCLDNDLKPWATPANRVMLLNVLRGLTGRSLDVLVEVAREAVLSAGGRPPSAAYGRQIIINLPSDVLTREQAAEHFRRRREGGKAAPAQPVPGDERPEEDEDPIAARVRRQTDQLRSSHAAAS